MTSPTATLTLVLAFQLHWIAQGLGYRADQLRGAAANTTPCRVRGRDADVMHGQQIERADPCEFCICIDSNVFCWWGQTHCDSNATADASLSVVVSTEPSLEEENSSNSTTTCTVMGREYAAGTTLPRETGTCLECVCGRGGRVTCSPKDCVHSDPYSPNEPDADPNDPSASLDMFDVDVF